MCGALGAHERRANESIRAALSAAHVAANGSPIEPYLALNARICETCRSTARDLQSLTQNFTPGAVPLELSLNAQDYTSDGVHFTFYTPTALSALDPPSGPALGATRLTVSGRFSALGSLYLCRFAEDEPLVPATRQSDGELACQTPPLSAGSSDAAVRHHS